ncbi:CHASE domain-containing protein [Aporhodopirellula aestuarii]|uniref:histidine kinase n=1 Tax=Aporhodopirellula aestuarii TaxID=2950107 RepID=A0ABT0U8Q3_9BACT|nr:CHASE domain-containing protein [Aporhodopirellula aestuarii]MCM2372910.1 CHASE domain-containing protein [Aporhodopirellula aestuarii]
MIKRVDQSNVRERLRRRGTFQWFHALTVVLSIGLTLFAWDYSRKQLQSKIQIQFDREAERIVGLVTERMQKYEEALLAASAFLEVDEREITRDRWRHYVDQIEIRERYPGINGLGVVLTVPRQNRDEFIAKQQLGHPDFRIYPEHDQPMLWPITQVVPERPNAAALGLDMAHETNRREAAEKARDSGLSQVTGPIVLVQDTQRTPGFLFFTPFYDIDFSTEMSLASETVRRARFEGLVYAPFLVRNLMRGTMERQKRSLGLRIIDGGDVLFDEHVESQSGFDPEPLLKKELTVPMYGRLWTFDLWSDLSFRKNASSSQPQTILWAGLLIDSLLIGMFLSISRASRKALKMADEMTQDLQSVSLATQANRIGIWDFDPITGKLEWDDAMFDLYGCSRDDFSGAYDAWQNCVHPDDREASNQAVQRALQGERSLDILFRVIHPDGTVRYLGGQGVVFRNDDGEAIRMLGANTDLTEQMKMLDERKQHLREIARANVELKRSNDELAQFAYVASHDLQAPLRRIVSLSQLLKDELGESLSEDAILFMSQIESSALSMRDLILDLLSYSQIESEKRTLVRCDVKALIDSAIENLSELIAECDGVVNCDDVPDINADPHQLIQLFQNLIGNSLKYRGDKPPLVRVSGVARPDATEYIVADNGIGIAPEHRKRVFGVFKRLHAESTYHGNGIGLAICKRIVDRLGGSIWIADSELGGTAFHISVPNVDFDSQEIR